ncbi:MAG: SRPBCC family protein [Rhodobacteraceae bacterium]|nr:SRPBCC family protein [Paracoccaceae bacterium]
MQFSSVQDINAPLDFAFAQISDFNAFEAYAMRTGAQVERKDSLTDVGPGLIWNFIGEIRGKVRDVDIELTGYRPPKKLEFQCRSPGIDGNIHIRALSLTRRQTRMKMVVDIQPLSIPARLVMQSARLAKKSLNRKFNHRVWEFANYIEGNYQRSR